MPVGHIEMVEPLDKALQDTTVETLSKEASADNIPEVKDEPMDTSVQTVTELLDVTTSTQNAELPDATINLIVALSPDMQLNLEQEPQPHIPPQVTETKPCSVKLYRCDIVAPDPKPTIKNTPIEVNVVIN